MSRKTANYAPITSVEEEIHDRAKEALLMMKELEKKKRKKKLFTWGIPLIWQPKNKNIKWLSLING